MPTTQELTRPPFVANWPGWVAGIDTGHTIDWAMVPERYRNHPAHPLGGPPGQMKRYENANGQGVTVIRNGKRDDDHGPRRVYPSKEHKKER